MNTLPEILDGLRSADDQQRADALLASRKLGASGIEAIALLLGDAETETRRAGKRALESIVHDAGKTGALGAEAVAVEAQLIRALARAEPDQARRDLVWLLSEVGGEAAIEALAPLLKTESVREDARCALERIPLPAAVRTLEIAFADAPEDYRFALAESLRKRGAVVEGYPSRRLIPTKATEVQPTA
jgi:HEAT repeat protein